MLSVFDIDSNVQYTIKSIAIFAFNAQSYQLRRAFEKYCDIAQINPDIIFSTQTCFRGLNRSDPQCMGPPQIVVFQAPCRGATSDFEEFWVLVDTLSSSLSSSSHSPGLCQVTSASIKSIIQIWHCSLKLWVVLMLWLIGVCLWDYQTTVYLY